jgi:Polyketide cyclase / dehydrase and lipid transport.
MLVYESQIVINAGAHRVWQVLSDVARWPQWLPTVTRVVPLDGEAIVVGGTLPGGAAEAEAGGVDGD